MYYTYIYIHIYVMIFTRLTPVAPLVAIRRACDKVALHPHTCSNATLPCPPVGSRGRRVGRRNLLRIHNAPPLPLWYPQTDL